MVTKLDYLRERKIAALEKAYAASLAAGITVNGVTLAATEQDQNTFTRLMVLLNTQVLSLSGDALTAFLASQQTITDNAGVPHAMSVSELRALLVGYGQAIAAMWGTMAAKRAAAQTATTIDELDAL